MPRTNITPLTSLQNEASAINNINNNFQRVSDVVDSLLDRYGQTPNAMNSELDMNNNRILNVPDPVSDTDVLRLKDLTEFSGGGGGDIIIEVSGALQFDTVAAFEAATVPTTVNSLVINGYYSIGDCPPMVLIKVGSEPTHYGKFQSDNGLWFELNRNYPIDIRHFGAKGDNSYTEGDVTKAEDYADLRTAFLAEEIELEDWLAADGAALYKLLKTAATFGTKATVSSGDYRIFGVDVNPDDHLWVDCSPNARFTAVPVSTPTLTKIQLSIDTGIVDPAARPNLVWIGGKFDGFGLPYGDPLATDPYVTAAGGARGGNFQATRFYYVTIIGTHVKGGTAPYGPDGLYTTPGYVQGDQGFSLTQCKIMTMIDCHGEGLPDSLVYPRTNANMDAATFAEREAAYGVLSIISCTVRNSYRGVYGKFAGGKVVVTDFRAYDTWDPIQCSGEYTPQIGEQGTGYQPYDITVNGFRGERIYRQPIYIDRAQVGAISDVTIIDWGRRPDGVASQTGQYNVSSMNPTGSYTVPVIELSGCENIVVNNVSARLLDWKGGFTELKRSDNGEPSGVTVPFLEGVLLTRNLHNVAADPGLNHYQNCKNIQLSNINIAGVPIVYDATGDGKGVTDPDAANRGTGAALRVRDECDDGTVRVWNVHAPNFRSATQQYRFRSNMYQYVNGQYVTSADGYPFLPDQTQYFPATIAAGVVVVPNSRVSPMWIEVDTEGGAASDNLDTLTGGYDGQTVVITATNPAARPVTVRTVDNLSITMADGSKNAVLDAGSHSVTLMKMGTVWRCIATSIPEHLDDL